MINLFRIGHLAYDLRNTEILEAFQKDPEKEMERYHLTEEEKSPLREKTVQPYIDAGMNANYTRALCQAMGIRPVQIISPYRKNFASPTPANIGGSSRSPEEIRKKEKIAEIYHYFRLEPGEENRRP